MAERVFDPSPGANPRKDRACPQICFPYLKSPKWPQLQIPGWKWRLSYRALLDLAVLSSQRFQRHLLGFRLRTSNVFLLVPFKTAKKGHRQKRHAHLILDYSPSLSQIMGHV